MEDKTREHMIDGSIWLRGLHMLLFTVAYNVVEAMMGLTAIFQFFCALITGRVNEPLLQFAKNGSIYIQEVMEFLTFNSEIRPFPLTPWPDEAHTGEEWLGEASDETLDEEIEKDMGSSSSELEVDSEDKGDK
tara:strand:- start:21601 stop:21999 length:399 start_codon:yes stop_codon:yes gene_type:complete